MAGVDEIEVVLGSTRICSKRAERRIPQQADDEEGYQASKPKSDQQSYSLLTNGWVRGFMNVLWAGGPTSLRSNPDPRLPYDLADHGA